MRRSPPEDPCHYEEWPVLFPSKTTTPDSLRQLIDSSDAICQPIEQTCVNEPPLTIKDARESFPILKPQEKVEITQSPSLKPVNPAAEDKESQFLENSADPTMSDVEVLRKKTPHSVVKGYTAVGSPVTKSINGKLGRESGNFRYPRPTRTSILRARQSSVPIPLQNEDVATNIEGTVFPHFVKLHAKTKTGSQKEFDIFEETRSDMGKSRSMIAQTTDSMSGQQYITKRLSANTSGHGPILKISRSAERVIMGKEPEKENIPKLGVKHIRDLRCAVTSKELHKATGPSATSGHEEQQPAHPRPCQSLPQSIPPLGSKYADVQTKKGRSSEVENILLANQPCEGSTMLETLTRRGNTKSSGSDDPFFDARSTSEDTTEIAPDNSETFPPQSSSRVIVPDYTSSSGSLDNATRRSSDEFMIRHNKLGESQGMGSSQIISTGDQSKQASNIGLSSNSQVSLSKTVLSNFRGLFHKRSGDHPPRDSKPKVIVTRNGSRFPPISEVHPIHRPTLASTSLRKHPTDRLTTVVPAPGTPTSKSPGASEVAAMTTLAMHLLDLARVESLSPKKEKYLEMGKVMVDVVTQAREAEKAMVEAKHAARKAEVAYLRCAKSVGDVAKNVQEWRDDIER